jgi:dienelactone hydrolase
MKRLISLLFFLLVVALMPSCNNDDNSGNGPILIEPDASAVVLEVKSKADNKMIPVYIAFPADRSEPLKGVVLLHGSGGPWDTEDTDGDTIADKCNVGIPSKQNEAWRDLLLDNGMVSAFPDSYSPRGTCENQGAYKDPPKRFLISGTFIRNRDAYAALELLRRLVWKDTKEPVMDPDNIALVGFSDGATSVISTVYDTEATPTGWKWEQSIDDITYTQQIKPPAEKPEAGGYKAAVCYYAGSYHHGYYGDICDAGEGIYRTYCDVLFHLPMDDSLTENTECLMATMAQNGGGKATAQYYDNTDHAFDGDEEPASTQARALTIDFIKEKLGVE